MHQQNLVPYQNIPICAALHFAEVGAEPAALCARKRRQGESTAPGYLVLQVTVLLF